MNKIFTIIFISIIALGCQKHKDDLLLKNKSGYDVEIELYVGEVDENGFSVYNDYVVPSKDKIWVEVEGTNIKFGTYSPKGFVSMEIDEAKGSILFEDL